MEMMLLSSLYSGCVAIASSPELDGEQRSRRRTWVNVGEWTLKYTALGDSLRLLLNTIQYIASA